jgi:hypothetical protein
MPEPLTLDLSTLPAPLPCPTLSLDDRPWRGGTVVAYLTEQRDGAPLPGLVWHARVTAAGVWSPPPQLLARQATALAGRRVWWLVVTWAGRRVGEARVRVG